MKPQIVVGAPGTGKTETIVSSVEAAIARGVSPERILFVSFTRAAKEEFQKRIDMDLPHVGTVHGIAFKLLKLKPGDVMDDSVWTEFGEKYGYKFTDRTAPGLDEGRCWFVEARTPDDELRFVHDWGRNRGLRGEAAVGACPVNVPVSQFLLFEKRLKEFKAEAGCVEFHDLLTRVLKEGLRPDVDLIYVDEAQDLSPMQIRLLALWSEDAKQVFIAGDPDQAIYGFGGADPAWLRGLVVTHGARVLDTSHRVPRSVHEIAQRIIGRNRDRVSQSARPAPREGRVVRIPSDDLPRWIDGSVVTLVLVRNRMFMRGIADILLDAGVPYAVEGHGAKSPLSDGHLRIAYGAGRDLRDGKPVGAAELRVLTEYVPTFGDDLLPYGFKARIKDLEGDVAPEVVKNLLGRGTLLLRLQADGVVSVFTVLGADTRKYLQRLVDRHGGLPEPVVTVTTIHAAKGRQAPRVVVTSDMSRSTWMGYQTPDGEESENRVFYTAITRAKDELVVIEPRTRMHFQWPRMDAAGREA